MSLYLWALIHLHIACLHQPKRGVWAAPPTAFLSNDILSPASQSSARVVNQPEALGQFRLEEREWIICGFNKSIGAPRSIESFAAGVSLHLTYKTRFGDSLFRLDGGGGCCRSNRTGGDKWWRISGKYNYK